MNYKLKHLSKYCCKPANELEFEAVKMAAEIGGVEFYTENNLENWNYFVMSTLNRNRVVMTNGISLEKEITVLDFCNKLRMTEQEAEKLEDDRVNIAEYSSAGCDGMLRCVKYITAHNGYYFKTNEDGTEVTLHKRD